MRVLICPAAGLHVDEQLTDIGQHRPCLRPEIAQLIGDLLLLRELHGERSDRPPQLVRHGRGEKPKRRHVPGFDELCAVALLALDASIAFCCERDHVGHRLQKCETRSVEGRRVLREHDQHAEDLALVFDRLRDHGGDATPDELGQLRARQLGSPKSGRWTALREAAARVAMAMRASRTASPWRGGSTRLRLCPARPRR